MADKWGWKLPETRVFEVRPEAGRVKRKKVGSPARVLHVMQKKEEGRCALKVKWNHGAIFVFIGDETVSVFEYYCYAE